MRIIAVIFAAALAAGCGTEKQTVLMGCEDVDDFTDQPVNTFLTLNSGLECDFSGTCAYGPRATVCGEPSDLRPVSCTCMSGTFRCYDETDQIEAARAACGS
ncbi:MAG: hypothetical protein R3F60_12485 [bacterium]